VEIHRRFVPGFEKASAVHCRMTSFCNVQRMVFHHPAPISRQSTLLPECLGRYDRGPDGMAAWRQEGAGTLCWPGTVSATGQIHVEFHRTSSYLCSKIPSRIRSGFCTVKFQITAAPAAAANASESARRAHSCRAARQTCRRERLASPVLRTCLIATTRYGKSRNPPPQSSQHDCS